MRPVIVLLITVSAFLVAADVRAQSRSEPTDSVSCPEAEPALVSLGQAVFAGTGNCAACHGPGATGTQLAPDLTDDEWLNLESGSFEEIAALVRAGVPAPLQYPAPMPPEGGGDLTEKQICAVAAYIRSLDPED